MKPYDHKKIEKKLQKQWQENGVYKTLSAKSAKAKKLKPYYVLDMFPYPSGAGLHVGHPRGYIASDVFARMKRMSGYNVLHPMGFDSFGLPAEQYAIQTGKHPGPFTDTLVKRYKEQLSMLGFSYDWDRQVETHNSEYYKWTQWIFLQIYNSWFDAKKQKARTIDELVAIFEKSGNGKVTAAQSPCSIFTAKEWKQFSEKEQQDILMNYRIAYEGYAEVNWCEELGTVLANDEIVQGENGPVSERGGHPVIKKQMRQWFMRITAYADRLLAGLEKLDWSHSIKEIQRNWIGKSEGSEIDFALENSDEKITVFTTRADTLFGVTYVVLAPEHELVQGLRSQIENWSEVEQYIATASKKDDIARTSNDKEKTGVQLKGVFAINPANGEQVPVWIADYVLAGYGTGAVMAVPAHDERDFAFANNYNLPIKQVVSPKNIYRSIAVAVTLKDSELFKQDLENNKISFELAVSTISGREHIRVTFNEDKLEKFIELVQAQITGNNWVEIFGKSSIIVRLESVHKDFLDNADDWFKKFSEWEPFVRGQKNLWDMLGKNPFLKEFVCFQDNGILRNSGEFSGLNSDEAKQKITEFVGGRMVTKYKFRDAIFARQRYWGEPIPLVHTKDGVIIPLKEKQLPLELPKVKSYTPAGNGESPLATVKTWVKDGYETNTMPGWAGSSWYFLRYIDVMNKKAFASDSELEYWFGKNGGVDMYVGGQEHATGHLLYSRFWHKVLHDLGYVQSGEPFKALRNQGMILAEDGRKMSKRWGNVINPDDVVEQFGADTMRVYEMFMGPFEASQPWSTDSMVGARRFIERIWRFQEKLVANPVKTESYKNFQKVLHKTIKKVTDDIAEFSFNTAVSAMMIFANEAEKHPEIYTEDFKKFIQVLAPFAPHIAEVIWSELGEKKSIHISDWPKYNPKLIIDDTITIGIQINGKVRSEITIAKDIAESDLRKQVLQIPEIEKWIDGKEVRKFIYVPGRIINIVI